MDGERNTCVPSATPFRHTTRSSFHGRGIAWGGPFSAPATETKVGNYVKMEYCGKKHDYHVD